MSLETELVETQPTRTRIITSVTCDRCKASDIDVTFAKKMMFGPFEGSNEPVCHVYALRRAAPGRNFDYDEDWNAQLCYDCADELLAWIQRGKEGI